MHNSILTNISALKIQNNLSFAQSNISTSLKRMASGIKLNQVKDGAAECVISSKMETQLSGMNVAIDNISHGQNLLNIADGVLTNMVEQTTRIKNLCLQSLNNTANQDELNAIQEEINQITQELERQRESTKYNGAKIFETKELKEVPVEKPYEKRVAYLESTGTQYIDTGYVPNENTEIIANVAFLEKTTDLQQFGCITNKNNQYSRWHFGVYQNNLTAFKTIQGSTGDVQKQYDDDFHEYYLSNSTAGIDGTSKKIATTTNSDVSFTLFARNGYVVNNGSSSVGYYTKSRVQDFKIYENSKLIHSYIPVVDYDGKAALYDEITGEMLYNQGSGSFAVGEEVEDVVEMHTVLADKEPTIMQIGSNGGANNTISVNLGFEFGDLNFDVTNKIKTRFAIQKTDELINALTSKLSNIGATANRMETIKELQFLNKVNLSTSNSSIKDTDIAQEATSLVHNQILQQISASLFSQAHQITGGLALRLLGVS